MHASWFYLESHGQRLVAPPVWGQHRAQEVGAVRAHQLARVVRQHVHYIPAVRPRPERARVGHGPRAVSDLAAGERRGGRREPSGSVYGNMHHNNLESIPKFRRGVGGVGTWSWFSLFSGPTDGLSPVQGAECCCVDGGDAFLGWSHAQKPKKRLYVESLIK